MNEKFIIYTWGCQMNEDDSLQLAVFLRNYGYEETFDVSEADIAILVTCSVREKPENKAKSKLGELRILKESRPHMIIGICGCMAQREGDKLRKGRNYLDFVAGTGNISQIPGLIENVKNSKKYSSSLHIPEKASDVLILPKRTKSKNPKLKEFVPIMYGCNNFCAYCVVPYVRGRERSRNEEDILDEIKYLVDNDTREITLLGQNVNSYKGGNQVTFADLLYKINDINGNFRIRFTTSHPKDMSNELIEAMKITKVCKHVHLPVQSGDSNILKKMNRKYDKERIYELVSKLRNTVPDIAISTDLIVGFPSEGDNEFQNTMDMVKNIEFDWAYMFSFNPIPNTPAAEMLEQMTMKEKNAKLDKLVKLQNSITVNKNKSLAGNIYEVLIESSSKRDETKFTGQSTHGKTVNFSYNNENNVKIGDVVKVRTKSGHLYGFSGEILNEQ